MIFNDASISVPVSSVRCVAQMLLGLTRGMAELVRQNRVSRALRLTRPLYDMTCALDGSVYDAVEVLRQSGAERDAVLFFMRLSQKVPLTTELPSVVVDRFRGCEAVVPNPADGEALVLCAHIRGIAVSIPAQPAWDVDQLEIRFVEIRCDGSIEEVSERVDNLSRAGHARKIIERDRVGALAQLTRETFWQLRSEVFPNLSFGVDVERQVLRLPPGIFSTVVGRIDEIHSTAFDWSTGTTPAPPWRCKVTPESAMTMGNPALRAARCFRDPNGTVQVYEWHARFGWAGRIHLRFDQKGKTIEIGYVGNHLPLA